MNTVATEKGTSPQLSGRQSSVRLGLCQVPVVGSAAWPPFRFVECERGRRWRRQLRGTSPRAAATGCWSAASPPPSHVDSIKALPPTRRFAHDLAIVSTDKSFLTYNCIDLILRLPAVMSCPCRGRRVLARPELRPPAPCVPPPCDRCCAWQQAAGCAGGGWLDRGRGLGRHVSGRVLHIRIDS